MDRKTHVTVGFTSYFVYAWFFLLSPARMYSQSPVTAGFTAPDQVCANTPLTIAMLPNAFTPNGDGHNDCFGLQHWGDVTLQEFSIFNRWGQRVFSTRNAGDCWDGTFNGKPVSAGGYTYVIKAASACGEITKTGIVLLIR